jgi:hypothetical protein
VSGARVGAGETFTGDVERAYNKTCRTEASAGLLVLETVKTGLYATAVRRWQTWLPEHAALGGLAGVDGFALLAVVFMASFVAQCRWSLRMVRERALETLRQPSLERWIEYVLTSPLQVVLVAMCVAVRDVQTVGLLFAAHLACVLLGFVLEFGRLVFCVCGGVSVHDSG